MKHLDLFSGIGGFALAARWMGWETVQFVEIDEFCQKVLKKNFPNVPIFGDITQFDGTKYKGTIDILTGGFPCQTFSIAGKGEADLTLWKEMFRIIGEVEPPFVLAENVPGIISAKSGMAFKIVCADLEDKGYQIQVLNIPACAVNAPYYKWWR
jgi:DNA (cytosine-5)-methyltransferase 1